MSPYRLLLLFLALTSIPVSAQMQNQASGSASAASTPLANQVVAGFTGGAVWTSGNSAVSIWYFPVLGNLAVTDLFELNSLGVPSIDRQHAYFIWVYDWKTLTRSQSGSGAGKMTVAVVPAGTATIYYSSNPLGRDWTDLTQRSTWGAPVATFSCGPAMYYSADGFQVSDKFYFSATLSSIQTVTLRKKTVNFSDLLSRGMTCFAYGQQSSSTQTGTCTALGN
jgi:hypothetical protein